MDKYLSDKNRSNNTDAFKKEVKRGTTKEAMAKISEELNKNITVLNNLIIEGKKITDYDTYKSHFPIFTEIAQKTIDAYELFAAWGCTTNQIQRMRNKTFSPEEMIKLFTEKIGIDFTKVDKNDPNSVVSAVLPPMLEKAPQIEEKVSEILYFSRDDAESILRGVKDYLELSEANKHETNPLLTRNTSLDLYKTAYELYLKILGEAYTKLGKPDKKGLFHYFKNTYPVLMNNINPELRHDTSHLKYTVRDDYTQEQLDTERNIIIIKAICGVIARNTHIVNSYSQWSNSVLKDLI